ncbi:MAG: ZIP family metal transporter [Bacteroidetes bacterium]|nr:ZIP family metal transporter [Bacteroidota bacterium]
MIVTILLAGIILSGCLVFFLPLKDKTIKLLLAFTGAYLLSLSVLKLIPEVYLSGFTDAGFFVLAGFFIQIIIEFFSGGIEHGHIHAHKNSERAFPVTIMTALSVHSFLEGLPLQQASGNTCDCLFPPLLAGIVLHNIPISISLMLMLISAGLKKGLALLWLTLFALMTPAGVVVGTLLQDQDVAGSLTGEVAVYSLALVIGIFLHISTTILFETGEEHRFNFNKLIAILLGVGVSIIGLSL